MMSLEERMQRVRISPSSFKGSQSSSSVTKRGDSDDDAPRAKKKESAASSSSEKVKSGTAGTIAIEKTKLGTMNYLGTIVDSLKSFLELVPDETMREKMKPEVVERMLRDLAEESSVDHIRRALRAASGMYALMQNEFSQIEEHYQTKKDTLVSACNSVHAALLLAVTHLQLALPCSRPSSAW
jgi:hypothetical protein